MNITIQEIIFKLSLIGRIKENQSLFTKGNNISIYEPNLVNWIFRKWTNDSKEKVVSTLNDLYQKLYEITNELTNSYANNLDKDNIIRVCNRLAESISLSVNGLNHLNRRYIDFPEITVKLECIVKDFILPSYEKIGKIVIVNDLVYNNVEIYKVKKISQSIAINNTNNNLYHNLDNDISINNTPISSTPKSNVSSD